MYVNIVKMDKHTQSYNYLILFFVSGFLRFFLSFTLRKQNRVNHVLGKDFNHHWMPIGTALHSKNHSVSQKEAEFERESCLDNRSQFWIGERFVNVCNFGRKFMFKTTVHVG